MASKKPPPAFEVLFSGSDIYPEKIPVGLLSRTLSAIHRLAAGKDEAGEEDEDKKEEDGSIRLLDIVRGSAIFRFVGQSPDYAIERLREAGAVLNHPETIGDKDYMLSPIERLSGAARTLKCSIVVKKSGSSNGVLARIEPTSFDAISKTIFVYGDTALSGRVERVGGATEKKCALRVPFQERMLFCKVETVEAARKLGEHLYEKVAAHGRAIWIKNSWLLFRFTITSVQPLVEGSLTEAFEALREAGGKAWDEIDDPESFLEEVAGH